MALAELTFPDPHRGRVAFKAHFREALLSTWATLLGLRHAWGTINGEVGIGVVAIFAKVAVLAIAIVIVVDARTTLLLGVGRWSFAVCKN
jgi:hypothetical protein